MSNLKARVRVIGIVHRKGAVRARAGETVLIPGSMGTASYVGEGLGNAESFETCQHGAGRAMSRTAARKAKTSDAVYAEMAELGVVVSRSSSRPPTQRTSGVGGTGSRPPTKSAGWDEGPDSGRHEAYLIVLAIGAIIVLILIGIITVISWLVGLIPSARQFGSSA